jgi:hypothetical protein
MNQQHSMLQCVMRINVAYSPHNKEQLSPNGINRLVVSWKRTVFGGVGTKFVCVERFYLLGSN